MDTIEDIWAEYRTVLKAFLHRRVSDADDVDDLLQEILIKTHTHLGDLREGESIKTWLFQIARNATIDFYRKTTRRPGMSWKVAWRLSSRHCRQPRPDC